MENQIIAFIPELTKQVENGNKTQTRRLKGLEKVNVSPDDYRFDGVDEKDPNIYYFEELKVGEPTENYIIARSKYKVGEIINVESTDKKIQITAVRAERLQNISFEDCKKEGTTYFIQNNKDVDNLLALESFMKKWDSLPDLKFDWSYNPFVWVYEFKLV